MKISVHVKVIQFSINSPCVGLAAVLCCCGSQVLISVCELFSMCKKTTLAILFDETQLQKWALPQHLLCLCSGERCLLKTSEDLSGAVLYSLMVYFLLSNLLLYPHPPRLKPIHNPKAPGEDRKALTMPLPQMKSTTQTRALLNTNAPNLPQLPTALEVSLDHGLSLWSPYAPNLDPETLRRRPRRETPSITGPTTALRLHGKKKQWPLADMKSKDLMIRIPTVSSQIMIIIQ